MSLLDCLCVCAEPDMPCKSSHTGHHKRRPSARLSLSSVPATMSNTSVAEVLSPASLPRSPAASSPTSQATFSTSSTLNSLFQGPVPVEGREESEGWDSPLPLCTPSGPSRRKPGLVPTTSVHVSADCSSVSVMVNGKAGGTFMRVPGLSPAEVAVRVGLRHNLTCEDTQSLLKQVVAMFRVIDSNRSGAQ